MSAQLSHAELPLETPFFFGRNGELFGFYHPSDDRARRAALLCPPLGQDYIRCHRLYRQLAHALAEEGFAVLRFDYFGTGDSAGSSDEVDWERCIDDTITAAAELRMRSGVKSVVAFGARLGGSLALAAAPDAGFADVVAWDPVIDGPAYVEELDELQAALRQDATRFTRPRRESDVEQQWTGFAVSGALRRQIQRLHLQPALSPSLVFDSLPETSKHRWPMREGGPTQVKPLAPTPWSDLHRLELAILSHPLIQGVTHHLRGAA
ncbi:MULTISPECIES: alpha/beta fold hydrolase [Dyella]|uniref:Alpha/beta fold hydrolase n=2 Tax=Dyella TaxID=231454 RepID=A0A4R0YGT1_9GAMM|nr:MULTISPECIES: alpha/beta fold hydrolase [Dyella]TBR36143.1 alpha/beta fold hydrolase [Dyella terrae]TCI06192.1 alpha/beta fold hydrolase [Dyella soli]